MSKTLKYILLFTAVAASAAIAWFIFSPSRKSGLMKYVPENTFALVKINLPEIAQVLNKYKDEVNQMSFMKDKDLSKQEPLMKVLQACMTSPNEAGINPGEQAFLYFENTTRGMAAGLLFGIKDKNKFAALTQKHVLAGGESGVLDGVGFGEFDRGTFLSWNENAALLSFNKTDGKAYCSQILNPKNANNYNKQFNKTAQNSDMVSGLIMTDEIFSMINSEESRSGDSIKNPFEPGSAFSINMSMTESVIRQEIEFISGKSTGKKPIHIFKKDGAYKKYSNQLFTREIPLYAVNISLDTKGILELFKDMAPNGQALPMVEMIEKVWSGDITMGISMSSDKNTNPEGYSADQMLLNKMGFAVHLGLLPGADSTLTPYLSKTQEIADGIRMFPMGNMLFVQRKDEVAVSNDMNLLRTGKGAKTDFKDNKEHMNSPLYIAMNTSELFRLAEGETLPSVQKILQSLNGYQYMWIDGNKLVSDYEIKEGKTHPLMIIMRFLEEIYQVEKNGRDPFREKSASIQ